MLFETDIGMKRRSQSKDFHSSPALGFQSENKLENLLKDAILLCCFSVLATKAEDTVAAGRASAFAVGPAIFTGQQ